MQCVCKDCGTVAEPKHTARGSMGVEIVLWLCFIVPGLIYSVWRLSSKRDTCPSCGGETLLAIDSPIGQQIATASGYVAPPPRPPSQVAVGVGNALGRLAGRLMK